MTRTQRSRPTRDNLVGQSTLYLLLPFLVLLNVACGTSRLYEGQARPPEEVGRVLVVDTAKYSIIGNAIRRDGGEWREMPMSDSAEVLPGSYTLSATYWRAKTHLYQVPMLEDGSVRFTVKGGQTAIISAEYGILAAKVD